METISGLYYSKEHEWVKVDDSKAYIGITDYAQNALGDIVFIELPEVDNEIAKEDEIGVIESVKAASDLYSPVSGTIIEVNDSLEDDPSLVNSAPFSSHILVIALSDVSELDQLMDETAYIAFCSDK